MNRRAAVILFVTVLGAALRVWGLSEAPPGLHPDEASNAWEAWCLRTAGASSDGRSWPLTFCMHGRFWVEGCYVWLVALAQLLPLSTEVAVRLPAALAGTALIPLTALLAYRLLGPRWAWFAALLVALEPLAIHTSRVGLRASLVPPILGLGLVLFLSERLNAKRGLAAGACAGLALWTYTPMRVWVPLLGLALLAAYAARVRRRPVGYATAGGLVVLALLASLPWTLEGDGRARLGEVAVWTQGEGALAGLAAFLKGHVLAFSPLTLFGGSSSRGFWAEGVSPLLWIEAPLLLLGVGSLIARARRRVGEVGPANARFLLLWLVLHPIPAALTVPAPNPLRGIGVLPLWALLGTEGARCGLALARRAWGRAGRRWAWRALLVAIALNAGVAFVHYFGRFPVQQRAFWFTGQGEAIAALLVAAEAEGASVTLECEWVEAALALSAGRAWNPEVEHGARARVTLRGRDEVQWTAVLDDEALVARAGEREVFRAAAR